MINIFSLNQKLLLVFLSLLLNNSVFAYFIISGEVACNGNNTYSYNFSETAIMPDYTVKVSETAIMPDITMKLVDNPKHADLILTDEFKKSDMKVCKDSNLFGGAKTIKVSETAIMPDVTVKLSTSPLFPDYKIYISSKYFTKNEATALFAILLKKK